jgi:tRNA wybutosine-synthesizing protein 1
MARTKKLDPNSIIPKQITDRLAKQGYQLYGKQVAVKRCLWTRKYLKEDKYCYKSAYGIQSHRCIQSTPTLLCTHQCVFCWRLQEKDLGLEPIWQAPLEAFDTPEEVYKGLLWGWKRCISGYKPVVSKEKWEEAMDPKHVTLSLAGEPTLYPFMTDLLQLLKKKGKTIFLVSNGTNPEALEKMLETNTFPTQLYITIPAPTKEDYLRTCRPLIDDGWERIQKTLELLSEIPTRTVARLTMVKSYNMIKPKQYIPMLEKANASFIEVKGFVPVGFSQYRVSRDHMPFIEDIRAFTNKISSDLPEYKQVYEMPESRVTILSNNRHPTKIPGSII